VPSRFKSISKMLPRSLAVCFGVLISVSLVVGFAIGAIAQTVEIRHWQGTTAVTRQPELAVAGTMAEWRSLWSRAGVAPPDHFEPGRMSAVGIFLGLRAGGGYFVNLLSAARRRDRIIVVFEERAPDAVMMAQRAAPPPPRPVASGPAFSGGPSNFMAPGTAMALSAPSHSRPASPPTSPWAIVLIPRADLPITVEQRLFR